MLIQNLIKINQKNESSDRDWKPINTTTTRWLKINNWYNKI